MFVKENSDRKEVCQAITQHLGSTHIRFPRAEEEMIQKPQNLKVKMG